MDKENDKIIYVPVEDILPNRFQPRLAFDEKELNDLSNSILRYGVIQPVVLRQIGNKYEIIAGERRYKATVLAGLKTIPAIIKNTDDNTSAEIALLENLQRKNLSVIEEAQSYKKLLDKNFTQEEIANKLGISQSTVANKLRLLNLPKKVQDALLYNKISERHARCLLTLNDNDLEVSLLEKIINNRLTVRQTEEEISRLLNKATIENDIPYQIKQIIDIKPQNDNIDNNESNTPNVVNIKEDSSNTINPFQLQFENNVKKIEETIQNHSDSYYDSIINSDLKKSNFEYNNLNKEPLKTIDDLIDKPEIEEEVNLPSIIGKVRKFVNELDNDVINSEEEDLPDKYRIIIEIKKNV